MRPQEPPGRAIAEDTGVPDTEYRARERARLASPRTGITYEARTLRLDASSWPAS